MERLEKLQERAVMYINNNRSNGMEVAQLYDKYGIQPLVLCRREHHSCVMYMLSKKNVNLEIARPSIDLRSNSKIHFKKRKRRKYEKYLKSPLVRGVKLWEMVPEKVQKAPYNRPIHCPTRILSSKRQGKGAFLYVTLAIFHITARLNE